MRSKVVGVAEGHEAGTGYITRINLDADGAHRVTLLADRTDAGVPLQTIDGSTWDPFARRLLFTVEKGSTGAVYQATPDFPSSVIDISSQMGRGGFEGIQNDSLGNLLYLEDVGGSNGSGANARPIPPSPPSRATASRTTATTRSPASSSPTATRQSRGSSGRRCHGRSAARRPSAATPRRRGASSGRSSTATTSPTS